MLLANSPTNWVHCFGFTYHQLTAHLDIIKYFYLMTVEKSIKGCVSICHADLFFFYFFFTVVVSIKWRNCWAKIELGLKRIWKSKSHYTWRKSVGDFCDLSSVSANWQNQMGGPGTGTNAQTQAISVLSEISKMRSGRGDRNRKDIWHSSKTAVFPTLSF